MEEPLVAVNYSSKSWYFLTLAVAISMCNQTQSFRIHHMVIGYIAAGSDLLGDTHTSTVEYGLLSGTAFLLVYAVFAMPVVTLTQSWLVDHIARLKWWLLASVLLLNLSTGLTALATSFWGLVWPRALTALFSTAVDPTLFRLLAYYFPPEKRGAASGVLFLAVYWGSGLSALTLLLARGVGWRLTFVIVASIGALICGGMALLLPDVTIQAYRNTVVKRPFTKDLKDLCKSRTLVITLAALFFRYFAGFGRGFFEGLYFAAAFPSDKVTFTVLYFIFLILAPLSLYVGGWFSDRKEATYPVWRPLICSVTNLAALPFLVLMYLSPEFWLAMVALFFVYFYGETYISVSFAMMINVTTPHIRALRE